MTPEEQELEKFRANASNIENHVIDLAMVVERQHWEARVETLQAEVKRLKPLALEEEMRKMDKRVNAAEWAELKRKQEEVADD